MRSDQPFHIRAACLETELDWWRKSDEYVSAKVKESYKLVKRNAIR